MNTTRATVDGLALVAATEAATRVVATPPKRPELAGVLLEVAPGQLRLVATDTVRLVIAELVAEVEGAARAVVVDAAELGDAPVPRTVEPLSVCIADDGVQLVVDGVATDLLVIPGTFPDYAPHLASMEDADAVLVDRAALLDAIEEQPDDDPLMMALRPGRLELGAVIPIALDVTYAGEVVRLLIDPNFLHDAVESTPGPSVLVHVDSPISAVGIRSPDDRSCCTLVMPMRSGAEAATPSGGARRSRGA